jgi:iron complex transport system substrate-binding protein
MIQDMGLILDRIEQADSLVKKIEHNFNTKMPSSKVLPYKVVYLIWKNPYMVVANDTFIQNMLKICGFENLFIHLNRYPQVEESELKDLKTDFIFLSSEPYPFNELAVSSFLPKRAVLVDGKAFSWYGSYLLESFDYFHALIHDLNKLYDNELHR